MPDAQPLLLSALLLDAVDEFERAAEHVPPPGRGGPVGGLSQAGWTIAHNAADLDAWINAWSAGGDYDPWAANWYERYRDSGRAGPPTDYTEAREAYSRAAEGARPFIESLDEAGLNRSPSALDGTGRAGQPVGMLMAHLIAHLFAHAGDLSVLASLLARPDLGLPGGLPRSIAKSRREQAPDFTAPIAVRLLLDAQDAFARVVDLVPIPAQVGAFERLNAGGWIVAHIAEQDSQYWSVHAQGLEPDPWLAEAHVRYGDPASAPDYHEARDALLRSFDRGRPYLEGLLDPSSDVDFNRVIRRSRISDRGDQTIADLVSLQLTHIWALSGELATIATLAGAPDAGLPGVLPHTLAHWGLTS